MTSPPLNKLEYLLWLVRAAQRLPTTSHHPPVLAKNSEGIKEVIKGGAEIPPVTAKTYLVLLSWMCDMGFAKGASVTISPLPTNTDEESKYLYSAMARHTRSSNDVLKIEYCLSFAGFRSLSPEAKSRLGVSFKFPEAYFRLALLRKDLPPSIFPPTDSSLKEPQSHLEEPLSEMTRWIRGQYLNG